jgi:hypothetical protein
MLEHGQTKVIFIKKDALVHYSVDSLKAYFPKLKWRICNNIHFQNMGENGFNGRVKYQKNIKYKKYLFVPYTVSTVIPFIQGVHMALTRNNSIYLLHPVLCWYVLLQIIYQYGLKLMDKTPKFTSYDGKKVIDRKG